ncbi:hypothetical protein [Sulfurimonas sp.]
MKPDRFGCELEFVVNDEQDALIIDKLNSLYGSDYLFDLKNSKISSDPKQTKVHYKYEASLESKFGRELTSPVCCFEELKDYLTQFVLIINECATTNILTGLHIHMSASDKSGNELDLCKYTLLADDENLLNNWGDRNKYCLNLMDIMGHLKFEDVILFKEHKGRVWNLLKRGSHHVEIRTFGGENYQNKIEQVIDEMKIYIEIFDYSTDDNFASVEYLNKLEKHAEKLDAMSQETIENYLTEFSEIGSFLTLSN